MPLEAHPGLRCGARGAKRHAVAARQLSRRVDMRLLVARELLVERLVRSRHADGVLVEEHQPLQIDFLDADVGGHLHEGRQLGNRLAQSGEPGRDPRPLLAFALLQVAEGADVLEDAAEVILAAYRQIGLRIGRIERDPKLVEPGIDQGAAVLLVEHGAVGIEQHVGAALLEIAHHAREALDQHRLADAVQDRALEVGNLIDDRGEQLPAHVGGRLELLVGARARRAQQVAAVGRLQIDTDRKPFRAIGARLADALEIAAGIDFRRGQRRHGAPPFSDSDGSRARPAGSRRTRHRE